MKNFQVETEQGSFVQVLCSYVFNRANISTSLDKWRPASNLFLRRSHALQYNIISISVELPFQFSAYFSLFFCYNWTLIVVLPRGHGRRCWKKPGVKFVSRWISRTSSLAGCKCIEERARNDKKKNGATLDNLSQSCVETALKLSGWPFIIK